MEEKKAIPEQGADTAANKKVSSQDEKTTEAVSSVASKDGGAEKTSTHVNDKAAKEGAGGGITRALRAPHNSRKRKQILGRGYGSGRGGTSRRGHKGHRSRSGFKALPFFEGGQMPLARRLPKVGFTNSPFKKHFKVVSLKDIEGCVESGTEITTLLLKQKRLVRGKTPLVKLTNKHKLTTLSKTFKVNIKEIHVTLAARKVLEASGSEFVSPEPAPKS